MKLLGAFPLLAAAIALSSGTQPTSAAPSFVQEQDASAHVLSRRIADAPASERESLRRTLLASRLQNVQARKANAHARILATTNATGPAYPQGVESTAGCTQCNSSLTFAGADAKKFAVGTQIPTLPFKTKNSWAGNIAVESAQTSKDAALYFWLWGKDTPKGQQSDSLVIWLNGGPGCSSLGGMVQENGPFLYESVNEKPYVNPYSWTRAADILYVEQPIKVGFTKGTSRNTNEKQLADEFASFLSNFYKTFPELAKKKLYVTGESYAGQYIPYFMNTLYARSEEFPQLQGGWIIDGVVTETSNQEDLVAYQYAVEHKSQLKFTDADVAQIKAESDKCNLSTYVDDNLSYPPKGRLPDYDHSCAPWELMYELAAKRNPTFNVYNINIPDPSTTSPLGNPNGNAIEKLKPTFFDNYKLQSYINAPHKKWVECANGVFVNGDQSGNVDATPSREKSLLANVIERSKRFFIMNGNLDALLITNGTSLALQNLTWNGAQGFTKAPTMPLYDIDGKQGGTFTQERGLLYAEIPQSGHMIPGDTPATGLASLEALLGDRDLSKQQ